MQKNRRNTAITAVVGALGSLVLGKPPTGIPAAWAENAIKDMMKRDGFGTYSNTLGSGSSTLPAPKEEYFSTSLYGEHRKVEVPRLEKEYAKAYVPWWPIAKGATTFKMVTDQYSGGKAVIQGGSHSGTSIGVGNDFGPQDKETYLMELDKANKSVKLSDEKLKAMKEKIDPYFGKMRSEACAYLRAHPLELDTDELKLLNARSAEDALKKARRITGFKDLSSEDQTKIFKRVINTGK